MVKSFDGPANVPFAPARTDNDLVALAAAGDADAYEELYARHKQTVTRVAYRFFARREEVEEIVQDTFTKAYFALASYRGAHERSFGSWLSQIAARVCYDELRRPGRQAEQPAGDLSDTETDYLEQFAVATESGQKTEEDLSLRDLAGKLLARLAPEDRVVLTLLHGEEFSSAEIAAHLGWSEVNVRVRALRARRSLQKILKKYL